MKISFLGRILLLVSPYTRTSSYVFMPPGQSPGPGYSAECSFETAADLFHHFNLYVEPSFICCRCCYNCCSSFRFVSASIISVVAAGCVSYFSFSSVCGCRVLVSFPLLRGYFRIPVYSFCVLYMYASPAT
jgi:hypothetical protein